MISIELAVRWLTKSGARGAAVLRVAMASMVSRVAGVAAALLSVPIVLHHVGVEAYGVWMAAVALSAFFSLADGGIAVGLTSQVSNAKGQDDDDSVARLLSAGLVMTTLTGLAFAAVSLVTVPMVDWTALFSLSDAAEGREASQVVLALCLAYCAAFPVNTVRQVRLGLLQGAAVNLWETGGAVMGLISLIVSVQMNAGLPVIAAVWAVVPVAVRAVGAIAFLVGPKGRHLFPRTLRIERSTATALLGAGGVYLIYTLTQSLSVQSDQILIAHYLGPADVADYSVVQRLFNQPQVIVTVFLGAQWPAYAEAMGRGDHAWIQSHFRKTLLLFLAFSVAVCCVLAVASDWILQLWVGDTISVDTGVVLSMAFYGVAAVVANAFAYFYLALRLHRRLIVSQVAMATINLVVTVVLLPRIGIAGAAVGTGVGYALALVLPGLLNTGSLFRSAEQRSVSPRRGII